MGPPTQKSRQALKGALEKPRRARLPPFLGRKVARPAQAVHRTAPSPDGRSAAGKLLRVEASGGPGSRRRELGRVCHRAGGSPRRSARPGAPRRVSRAAIATFDFLGFTHMVGRTGRRVIARSAGRRWANVWPRSCEITSSTCAGGCRSRLRRPENGSDRSCRVTATTTRFRATDGVYALFGAAWCDTGGKCYVAAVRRSS